MLKLKLVRVCKGDKPPSAGAILECRYYTRVEAETWMSSQLKEYDSPEAFVKDYAIECLDLEYDGTLMRDSWMVLVDDTPEINEFGIVRP